MHVFSGHYKGKRIKTHPGIRPTMGKVREALFNIIMHSPFFELDISQLKFLDLFCGSGSVGIEAISRGVSAVTMIDIDTRSAIKNVHDLKLVDKVKVLDRDILKLRDSSEKFNVVFIDPPYCNSEILETTLNNLKRYNWMEDNCVIFIESREKIQLNDFKLIDFRKYGNSKLTVLGNGSF